MSATSAPTAVIVQPEGNISVTLPATGRTCSTRFSSQEVWPGTTTSLQPPGDGYPNVFQRIDASGLDIWRVQAVDGYNDATTTLVSPSAYTSSTNQTLSAWNFNTLDKQLSDGPTGAVRELDMVHPPDALWTGTGPIGGDGSPGTLADQSYGALASYEANVVRYFRTGILQANSGSTVSYTGTSVTDTSTDFTPYAGGGYALTATVLDDNGFPDWETTTITGVTNGGHTVTTSGWSISQSNALNRVSTPVAGAAYNLASATPPITSPAVARPWPRPPSVGNVGYLELFNEPDLSNSSFPRTSPSLPPPTPVLTGVNVPGGTLTPGTTYAYRIAAANIAGALSLATPTETSITLPDGDNAVRVDWSATSNLGLAPFAYRIFGRTPGGEQAMVSVGKDAPGGLTWTDDGSVTPSGGLPQTDRTPGFQLWRAREYTRMWNIVAPAVKAVDPAIRLVGPTISNPISLANGDVVTTAVTSGPGDNSWISNVDYIPTLMAGGNPRPDAVSFHGYGWYQGTGSTEVQEWGGLTSAVTGFISEDQTAVGGTPVLLDETNIDAGNFGNPPPGGTATNLRAETQMGSAWLADSYVQWCSRAPQIKELVQFEAYNGDVAWGLFSGASYSGSTTCVPQPACQNLRRSQPNLEYWLLRAMNGWLPAGSAVVPVSGVPPGFAAFAVQPASGEVVVVVVNTQVGAGDGNGEPGLINVALSGSGVSDAQSITIDGSTDPLNGPSTKDLGAHGVISLSMAGYGVTLLKFTTA